MVVQDGEERLAFLELMTGLSTMIRGTTDEKLRQCFMLYEVLQPLLVVPQSQHAPDAGSSSRGNRGSAALCDGWEWIHIYSWYPGHGHPTVYAISWRGC